MGEYKGQQIQEVKEIIQYNLISNNQAMVYYEPLSQVVSRRGDECYVALVDQWYLNYSCVEWKDRIRPSITEKVRFYNEETKQNFLRTLDWIQDHACSRKYGIGTVLPFDENGDLIDSLSDSTIYMAYYTVSHFFQKSFNGNILLTSVLLHLFITFTSVLMIVLGI